MEKQYVIIRTDSAGVHMGILEECTPTNSHYAVTLSNTRRIWSWAGANTLTDLAARGSTAPKECKISRPIAQNKMMAIEIIAVEPAGKIALDAIPNW
jgi:hypothetical protein